MSEQNLPDAKDHIRKEVLKTGFPLELEVFSMLKPGPWVVTAQDYYYDEDEKKARYVDLSAFSAPIVKGGRLVKPVEPIEFIWNLAIECKKSAKNWIFFPVEDWYIGTSGQTLNYNMTYLTGLGFGHYNPSESKTASIYTILDSGKDEIFEAVMQVVKYISYSKKKIENRTKHSESSKYSINFWFPIIVLDGRMWNIIVRSGQITDINESQHTLLKVQYGSFDDEEEPYVIDVVNKSYFPKLMNIIHQDIVGCEKTALESKGKIIEYLDKAFHERQQPSDSYER